MTIKKQNVIVDKTFQFSLEMIKYCEILYQERKFVIANQLLKSSTSIGANVMEAQHGESPADFLHKMKIASKEANETYYWLSLCEHCIGYKFEIKYQEYIEEIINILSKIIITSKSRSVNFLKNK
jgi:four helix bundle protein